MGWQGSPGLVETFVPLVSQAVGLEMRKSCLVYLAQHESHQNTRAACLPVKGHRTAAEKFCRRQAESIGVTVVRTFSLRLRSVLACLLKICSKSGSWWGIGWWVNVGTQSKTTAKQTSNNLTPLLLVS